MLTRSNIEAQGFTFFRRVEGEDLYSVNYRNVDDRNEYIGQAEVRGYPNLVTFIQYDDGRVVFKVLLGYLNTHWSDDYLFTGEIETNEQFINILSKIVKGGIKPVKFV